MKRAIDAPQPDPREAYDDCETCGGTGYLEEYEGGVSRRVQCVECEKRSERE